jgi:hypothetical protein
MMVLNSKQQATTTSHNKPTTNVFLGAPTGQTTILGAAFTTSTVETSAYGKRARIQQ